jgi:hypothetical protein
VGLHLQAELEPGLEELLQPFVQFARDVGSRDHEQNKNMRTAGSQILRVLFFTTKTTKGTKGTKQGEPLSLGGDAFFDRQGRQAPPRGRASEACFAPWEGRRLRRSGRGLLAGLGVSWRAWR